MARIVVEGGDLLSGWLMETVDRDFHLLAVHEWYEWFVTQPIVKILDHRQ